MSTIGSLLYDGVAWKLHQLMVNEPHQSALAARLRQALEVSGKHQTELAALFEISDAAVSKWLRSGKIGRDRLPTLARFLGVNLQWLAEGAGPMRGTDLTDEEKAWVNELRALEPEKRQIIRATMRAMLPVHALHPSSFTPPPPQFTDNSIS